MVRPPKKVIKKAGLSLLNLKDLVYTNPEAIAL